MAIQNFRTLDLAITFYRECKQVQLPHALKDQLIRAASSIPLNLAEGSAKPTRKDRLRYYSTAFGSLREVQTIIQMEQLKQLEARADHLAACLHKLVHQ